MCQVINYIHVSEERLEGYVAQIDVSIDVAKGQERFFNPRYNFGVSKMKKKKSSPVPMQ